MRYSDSYQKTRDIDWFFRAEGKCIHVASNGGELPYIVNDIEWLRNIQAQVSTLEEVKGIEVIVNEQYVGERTTAIANNYLQNGIETVTREQIRNLYLSSFIAMARKGFYSYDRIPYSNSYMFICGPKTAVNMDIELPTDEVQIIFMEEDKSLFLVERYF